MFWDNIAKLYPIYVKYINGKVNTELSEYVASKINKEDLVLECACGTGMITQLVAPKCKHITATDYSTKMLEQTKKICKNSNNIKIEQADIQKLNYPAESFDKVIAGNVIHLVNNPNEALNELLRVCKTEGYIIIPTYVNKFDENNKNFLSRVLEKIGVNFENQFTKKTYQEFFESNGLYYGEYKYVEVGFLVLLLS